MSKKPTKDEPKSGPDIDELDELQEQVESLTRALQQERADAINLRRRHEDEMAGVRTRVKANVIRDLIPVIDNLERSLKHAPREIEGSDYFKGIAGIVKQFEKALKDLGVDKIKTVDQSFDPKYHEAVSMEEGEGTKEVVSEELQSGYTVNGEVIRHAMVRVKMA
jgi:molecular chaperone GrpE